MLDNRSTESHRIQISRAFLTDHFAVKPIFIVSFISISSIHHSLAALRNQYKWSCLKDLCFLRQHSKNLSNGLHVNIQHIPRN